MSDDKWPERWQPEAIEAVAAYVDSDFLVEMWLGPTSSIDGTLLAGYVYTDEDGHLRIIHDRSGRSDVYPGPLLAGPVLRVAVRLPGKRRTIAFAHPDWTPRDRPRR
jgi:hypothetical protein